MATPSTQAAASPQGIMGLPLRPASYWNAPAADERNDGRTPLQIMVGTWLTMNPSRPHETPTQSAPDLRPLCQVFKMSSQDRAQNRLYYVKAEDIKHVIEDQAKHLQCSGSGLSLFSRVLLHLYEYVRLRDSDRPEDYESTIKLSTTWVVELLIDMRKHITVAEEVYQDVIDPLIEWVLAEAGKYFCAGPDCRNLECDPQYFEPPLIRSELIEELGVVAGQSYGWAADALRHWHEYSWAF